jgi:uncharacterized protein (TIGR03083 family)
MIETTHLFPVLNEKLVTLLRSLNEDEWNKKTLARMWTVKDMASHLLDTNLRILSQSRDGHKVVPDREIREYHDLVGYLNKMNADWVSATRRLSPNVITDLLDITGPAYAAHFSKLDPHANANISVAWAGEEVSKNWFHIAREYTEKWHHQQQIREATGRQEIMTRALFYPVMQTFMRGMPHAYRHIKAEKNSTVQVSVETEIGGVWYLVYTENSWRLSDEPSTRIVSSVRIKPDIAWKLFTKGITPEFAEKTVIMEGNREIAKMALRLVAVMA